METNSIIEDGDQGYFWNSNVFDRFRSDLLQSSVKLETVLRFFKCHCSALIMCKVVLNVYQVGFLALRNYQSLRSPIERGSWELWLATYFVTRCRSSLARFPPNRKVQLYVCVDYAFVPPGVGRSPIVQKGPFVRAALISRLATRWPARVSGRSLF